jgi:hypothetical protein
MTYPGIDREATRTLVAQHLRRLRRQRDALAREVARVRLKAGSQTILYGVRQEIQGVRTILRMLHGV